MSLVSISLAFDVATAPRDKFEGFGRYNVNSVESGENGESGDSGCGLWC